MTPSISVIIALITGIVYRKDVAAAAEIKKEVHVTCRIKPRGLRGLLEKPVIIERTFTLEEIPKGLLMLPSRLAQDAAFIDEGCEGVDGFVRETKNETVLYQMNRV